MPKLIVISRSLSLPASAAGPALSAFFSAVDAGGDEITILSPEGLVFSAPPAARIAAYPGTLGIERIPQMLADFRGTHFASVIVLGSRPPIDFEEIVFSCYLSADRKEFLDSAGGLHDISAKWQPAIRPSFAPRPVEVSRFTKDAEYKYIASVHKWVGAQLQYWEYRRPKSFHERDPQTLLYKDPRLAYDLVQHTPDLQVEAFDQSFSTVMLNDGRVVYSADYYRAMANFVTALPGIESVLDVGCGSGFLACHLVGSNRYKAVAGVDASSPRVSGAALHAKLVGFDSIKFRQMSMDRLEFPDSSFDLITTSFALEQSGEALGRVFSELRRVARKFLILFEPSTEFFPTLASMWHVPYNGWANQYARVLTDAKVSYAVRPNLLCHYFNPGTVFVVDLQTDRNPMVAHPHLFRMNVDEWPGGIRIHESRAD